MTVIFDFGWTLAEYAGGGWSAWSETVGGALARLQEDLAVAAGSGKATEYERAVLAEIEEARASGEPIEIDGIWACISRDHGPYSANSRSKAIDRFGTALTDDWRLYAETVPVLDILSRRRVVMGLVSDVAGPTVHWASLAERLGINHYIRAMAFSEELGAIKPDPRGILSVLNHLNADPEDAVYVGDTPSKDIDAAVAAGVKAIWLRRRPEAQMGSNRPAHTVDSLRGLLSLV